MSGRGSGGGAATIVACLPLAIAVVLGALGGLHHEQGNGSVGTSTIVFVQGGFGGGTVLLYLLGAASGWAEVRGRPWLVPSVLFLVCGIAVMVVWLFAYISAYGS